MFYVIFASKLFKSLNLSKTFSLIKLAQREKKIIKEQSLFTEIVFMSLRARLNLKDAIYEASRTTNYLRPYLQVCLNQWHINKIRALVQLKKQVGITSFQVVVDLLIQAAKIGDDKIIDFLEENKKLEDEIKNIEISAISKARPVFLTLQMIIPMLVVLLVLFYPLITQTEKIIRAF